MWPACGAAQPAHLRGMQDTPKVTVWYDGACPLCAREVASYQRSRGAEGVCFRDVAAGAAPPPGVARDAALARFHVRDGDGRLHTGAAGFAALWAALPGWAWLARLAALPGVLPVMEGGYRGFLRLRHLWR